MINEGYTNKQIIEISGAGQPLLLDGRSNT
jgi:hypothetical protein